MRINYFAAGLCLLLSSTPLLARADVLDSIGHGSGGNSTATFQREQKAFAGGKDWISETGTEKVNWTGFLDRLYTLLTSDEYLGQKCPECKKAAELAKSMGEFNLAGTMQKCSVNGTDMQMQFGCYYKDLDPKSLDGRFFALPDAPLVSSQYVAADGHLFYFGANHLIEKGQIEVDAINAAKKAGGDQAMDLDQILNSMGAGDLGMVLGLASATGADQMAKDMLSGEAAVVLYNLPALDKLNGDVKPADFGAALLLGLADSSKLDKMIAGLGAKAGLVAMDTAGSGWKGYTVPNAEGITLVYNKEIAAVVTNPAVIEKIKADHQSGGMKVASCQYYLDVDVAAMQSQLVAPLCELGLGELNKSAGAGQSLYVPSKEAAFLLNLPDASALGRMTASGHHDSGSVIEVDMKTAVLQYMLYYAGIVGCVAAQESDKQDSGDGSDSSGTDDSAPPAAPSAPGTGGAPTGSI